MLDTNDAFFWGFLTGTDQKIYDFHTDADIQEMIDTICWEGSEYQLMRIADYMHHNPADEDCFELGVQLGEYADKVFPKQQVYHFVLKSGGKIYFFGESDQIREKIEDIF